MMKLWKLTLFFLLCLVIFLLLNLPIKQVLPYVELPPSIRLAGIDGNILKGRAAEIVINEFPVRGVRYRFMPSCIPLLKVCYKVDYDSGRMQLAYDVLNGDAEVSNSRVEYPVTALLAQFPSNLPVRPSGSLQLEIDDMSMQGEQLVAVAGKLVWRDLGLNDDGIRLSIGDYQVAFTGDATRYDFDFNDLNADLSLNGKGSVDAQGAYQLNLRIEGKSGIEPQVRSVLNLVAQRTSVDKYRVEQQGRLPSKMTRQLFP